MLNQRLITARKAKGWTQADLASLLTVSTVTISRWENGVQIPQAYYVQQLCQIFATTDEELGLCQNTTIQEIRRMVFQEMSRFFTFGKQKTEEIVLDGDGTRGYLPEHIRSHYIPTAQPLPEEFQMRKDRIQQEQEQRQANGDTFQWNGERYSLIKFNIGRDPLHEDMTLGLWFAPSDYYTFLATNMSLEDSDIRKKYLAEAEFDEAIPLFSSSFSTLVVVVTSDNHAILVQRSKAVGCRPNTFDISLAEGLSRPIDGKPENGAPDAYRCAIRGLAEELGLHSPADFSPSDVKFLSFAFDTTFCMWGLFGMVKLHKTADEVLQSIQRGVRDRFENRRLFAVPFTPEEIGSFIYQHQPFSPGGLVCLYHALVHEFGRERVDAAIANLP